MDVRFCVVIMAQVIILIVSIYFFLEKRIGYLEVKKKVTIQQVCALAALTVRKPGNAGKNPIAEGDFEWIFARNCEGTEQLQKKYIKRWEEVRLQEEEIHNN